MQPKVSFYTRCSLSCPANGSLQISELKWKNQEERLRKEQKARNATNPASGASGQQSNNTERPESARPPHDGSYSQQSGEADKAENSLQSSSQETQSNNADIVARSEFSQPSAESGSTAEENSSGGQQASERKAATSPAMSRVPAKPPLEQTRTRSNPELVRQLASPRGKRCPEERDMSVQDQELAKRRRASETV